MGELSAYEESALRDCVKWREDKVRRAPQRLVPGRVRNAAGRAQDAAKKMPGAARVADGMTRAATGVSKMVDRLTDQTLDPNRVLRAYRRRGVDIAGLDELRTLDLKVVDRASHVKKLRSRYAAAAAVEGGAIGVAITGGQVATTVAAAPGIGLIAAASVGDAAATLSLASHVVTHTAFHYGYDASSPQEEMFKMAVIANGMAVSQSAKSAAFAELYKLTMLLARKATWDTLNKNLFAKLATRFAAAFGEKLTKKKLGQYVPFAGAALGAGLNFQVIDEIGEAANWAYRERFLRDKLGHGHVEGAPDVVDVVLVDGGAEVEQPILVLGILDEVESDSLGENGPHSKA